MLVCSVADELNLTIEYENSILPGEKSLIIKNNIQYNAQLHLSDLNAVKVCAHGSPVPFSELCAELFWEGLSTQNRRKAP